MQLCFNQALDTVVREPLIAVTVVHVYYALFCTQKLTIHIPYSNDIWFKRAFEYLKQHPHNLPLPNTKGGGREKNIRLSQAEVEVEVEPASQLPAYFTGP